MSSPCLSMYRLCSMSLSCKLLLEIGPLGTRLGQAIDRIHHQVEAVQVVHDRHVEGRRDRALFLVAPDVQVAVGPAVGQPVDQPGVSVEGEDDVLVFREERIVIRCRSSPCGCSVSGSSFIRSTTLTTRIFSSGRCSRRMETAASDLQRGHVAAAGHHHVRLGRPGRCWPIARCRSPPCNARRRRPWSAIAGPRACRNHDVDVVPAAQAMIHDRQQAVGVGRQVDAHDLGLLVDDVVDEAGVLVREAVVVLPPDVWRPAGSSARRSSAATAVRDDIFSHLACWLNIESTMWMNAS